MKPRSTIVEFPNGNKSRCVTVPQNADIETTIEILNLPSPRALLIINGGTADLDRSAAVRLKKIYKYLAKFIIDEEITIVTGGTNAELFLLFGKALRKFGDPVAPCIGVTVKGKTGYDRLETNHSHFILVEGDHWGEETSVMYNLISVLSNHCPSLAFFAGGGEIAIKEMLQNVDQNREMIFLEGLGGLTDEIIAAKTSVRQSDKRIENIINEARITVLPADQTAVDLVNIICGKLLRED
jgi:hypothetical protein